jgi:hypothetical protein
MRIDKNFAALIDQSLNFYPSQLLPVFVERRQWGKRESESEREK